MRFGFSVTQTLFLVNGPLVFHLVQCHLSPSECPGDTKISKTMKWEAFVEPPPLKLAAAAMQKVVTRSGMQGFCCVGKKCCFARVQSAHKNY